MAKIGAGVLSAAVRQGADEIGVMLKAFPDSIQVSEPGTMWSPLPSEIAEANRGEPLETRLAKLMERTAEKQEPAKGRDRE
jgi:hypothetical protein